MNWFHDELHSEFDRLSSAGVNFSNALLQTLIKTILRESKHPEFISTYMDPKDKKQVKIEDKITYHWVLGIFE